ncbi:DPP IV N-terminal domain-containing protein [Saccharopolyspora spinosa]|uniref:S9 family peptidase n=1 Tax=Saccharopolyspora spinosa TaxID=60894 RepID=UPI0037482F80
MTIDWQSRYKTIRDLLADPNKLVRNATVHPRWIGRTGKFWYDRHSDEGREVRIVDAGTGDFATVTLAPFFVALETELKTRINSEYADLTNLDFTVDPVRAIFEFHGRIWSYLPDDDVLSDRGESAATQWAVAPDETTAVLVRDNDLWLRDGATGAERRLTTDGSETNAYASVPLAARAFRVAAGAPPEGLWSPDSRYFLTVQTDERHVPELALVDFVPGDGDGARPVIHTNRTSLPGDPKVTEFRVIAVEAETGRQIEARYPRLPAVRMNDTIFAGQLAWWSPDSKIAYFVDIERGEKAAHVVAFDIATGSTRVIFSEMADKALELGVNVYGPALVEHLPGTNEVIWYSERTGRGHLYLYDLETGDLRNSITRGDWQVRELLGVDTERREVRFLGLDENDPYLRQPCIASLDGQNLRVLSDEPGDHKVWRPREFSLTALRMLTGADTERVSGFSPDGRYFVETVAYVDRLPRSVLRARTGELLAELEVAENIGLPADWEWPESVTVLAADGETEVHGLLFKPVDFDPDSSYPVIDHIYGGPQVSWTPKAPFIDYVETSAYIDTAAFARLGAFALVLDGRGTANRERDFRQASYGAAHTASDIDDHIAGIRQLAERYPAMDLSRVGITGFSGGGYATALAALRRGEFFSVAVAGGGNYDQRLFWHGWGERYHGDYEAGHYREQAARTYAEGLTGKLLFVHGLNDWGCHPAGLFQLTQALIDADKDFDLILLPNAGHDMTGYGTRRRFDYFVTHLFGETPPRGVKMGSVLNEIIAAKIMANAAAPVTRETA